MSDSYSKAKAHSMAAITSTWIMPLIITVILSAILLLLPQFVSTWIIVLSSSILMYMILAVTWTVFCGPTQYFSLGIAAFFGVGVYGASIIWGELPELPLVLVIALAGAASSFLALLVGLTTLRIKGMYFAIFTFGLSEFLRHFVMWWEVNKTGTVGRWIPVVPNEIVFRYMVVIAAITILGSFFLRRSRYGLAMTSIGDGEDVAEHMGVNSTSVKIIVFAATCFLSGAAGALIATRWSYIDADVAFDGVRTVITIMMSLFGGMSALYGPIIGSISLGIVSDVLLAKFPYVSRFLLGSILVLTVLFIPEGIAGLISGKKSNSLFSRWKRRAVPTSEQTSGE
jgi:branched-chain amino acid transport system permease protein